MQSHKKLPLDLLIILIWTIFTLIFVFISELSNTPIRTVLGIPMTLFIPGYVLIAALFPKKDELGAVECIGLSFGLSIAVVSLLGILLNSTFGIKLVPITLALCIYTVVLILVAVYRRKKLPQEEQFSIPFHRIREIVNNEISANRTDKILTISLILTMVFMIIMIYFVIATPKMGERFTEFYILDASGKAENYPVNLQYNSPATILVGVSNHEYTPVNYTVQVALNKQVLTDTWFSLDHNETWEKNMTFVPDNVGTNMELEFWLFKEDNFTAPYRELHLWVNVTK